MAPKRSRLSRGVTRHAVPYTLAEKLIHLVRKAGELLHIHRPPFVYHMDEPAERLAMIDMLWSGDYTEAMGLFSAKNEHLVTLFSMQGMDDRDAGRLHERTGPQPRFESTLASLFRSRTQKLVPLATAALSIRFLHFQTQRSIWTAVSFFSDCIMSRTWTETVIDEALTRPGSECPYPTALGISGAVFDNFRLKCGYGTYSTQESTGYAIDMTNWATVFISEKTVPDGSLDFEAMLQDGGIFRADMVLEDFIDVFSPIAPDIVSNQHQRWRLLLDATANGTLWTKEPFASPFPRTHFHYHDPIFDRGQSSYEDVNFCLDLMRQSKYHKYSQAIMLGGDGLSYMRLIDRIAQDRRKYLWTTPVIIPRLGEAPHGKFHVMHGSWRLWEPLLMKMALIISNKQVVRDPQVSQFNSHEHFVRIVTTAFAEYILEISKTGMHYHSSKQFLNGASANLSFSYICNFLFLFGFHYVQFRSSVRRNDSKMLDTLWREFLSTARTDKANKTNYSKMTVALIYWGACLVEPLQTVYHNTRTLRLLHTHVGWDMPIEVLNLWIRLAVVYNVTREYLCKFIARINFTHVVVRGLDAVMKRNQANLDGLETVKAIETDKELIKAFLRKNIGTTWAEVTAPSAVNTLGLDLTDWGGDRNDASKFANTPWAQIKRSSQNYREYIKERLTANCGWHKWL